MVLIIVGITGVNSHPSQVVMSCGMALGSSLAFYNNTMYLIQIVILAEKLYNSTAIDFIVIDLTKTIRVWDDGMGNHLQLSPHFGSTITQLITRIRLVNNWRIAHTSFMISLLGWIWTLCDTQALSQTWAHMSRLLARSGKGSVVQTITQYSLIATSRILCVTLLKSLAQTCLRLLVVLYCGCFTTTVDSGEWLRGGFFRIPSVGAWALSMSLSGVNQYHKFVFIAWTIPWITSPSELSPTTPVLMSSSIWKSATKQNALCATYLGWHMGEVL